MDLAEMMERMNPKAHSGHGLFPAGPLPKKPINQPRPGSQRELNPK
jgi:hypothetical protein